MIKLPVKNGRFFLFSFDQLSISFNDRVNGLNRLTCSEARLVGYDAVFLTLERHCRPNVRNGYKIKQGGMPAGYFSPGVFALCIDLL